ncbi:hypothetical protein AMTRI_Chr03g48690 [Amborella trichopoda]
MATALNPPLPSSTPRSTRLTAFSSSFYTSSLLPKLSLHSLNRDCKFKFELRALDQELGLGLGLRSRHSSSDTGHFQLLSSSSATPMSTAAALKASPPVLPVKRVCLFYCDETRELAERVAAESDAVELRSISWRYLLLRYCERFYFGDNVLPCFESGIPLLKQRLQQLDDSNNITIAFPDDGAWKRFHKQLQHFPMIICTKVREGDQRIVRLKEGNAQGRHVVIVDDLVQSGSTLIECQKVLAAHGAAKVSAYVTHGVCPNRSWERFQHDNGVGPENGFSYFWITDSYPLTVKQVSNRHPFEVLSLAGAIAAALQI